jgi:ubiquinol-cytochrome c reductase cytochrome c1 subunit
MMRICLAILFCAISGISLAAGGSVELREAKINPSDAASLQRGAKLFIDRCLSCHEASYMRFNRLTDIGLSSEQIKQYLIKDPSVKVGDTMTNAMRPADAKVMFGVVPPDLSVVSRSRGADWLYTYFVSFYKDDASVTGWNNALFPHVAMPHVFWQEQGVKVLQRYDDGKAVFVEEVPGTATASEFDRMMLDLTNYLVFMGEPAAEKRKQIGSLVLIFLVLFAFLAWAVKREFWKDVH